MAGTGRRDSRSKERGAPPSAAADDQHGDSSQAEHLADAIEPPGRVVGTGGNRQTAVRRRQLNQIGIAVRLSVATVDDGPPGANRFEDCRRAAVASEDEGAAYSQAAGTVEVG